MKTKLLNNATGQYFVSGLGFTGTKDQATVLTDDESVYDVKDAAEALGLVDIVEVDAAPEEVNIIQNDDGSSFEVYFVRHKDLAGGAVLPNKNNPSKRRFRTEAEARHHGARFVEIENHAGYYSVKVYAPVNAWINQVTGKTNPEIGRARVNR
jgi:hypothetical protein